MINKTPWLDPIGLATVMRSLSVEASKYIPGYRGGMSFQIQVGQHIQVAEGLRWAGIDWGWQRVLLRLFWVAASAALAIAVSFVFDRFDNQKASAGDAFGGRQLPQGSRWQTPSRRSCLEICSRTPHAGPH